MPKLPDKVQARAPRRYLIDVPGGEEEEVLPPEIIEIQRKEQTMEEARRKKEETKTLLEPLLDRLESTWDEYLDRHRSVTEHKAFEYVDAFDNEDFLWWLNYTLLTNNSDDMRNYSDMFETYYEVSNEQEGEQFDRTWSDFLYDEFDEDERHLLTSSGRHFLRFNNIFEGAYEGFSEAWMTNEEWNLDDVYKEIPLLAWKREVYYLPNSVERRVFMENARKFLSHGTLNDLLLKASEHGFHLARIGAIFDGKVLARHAFFHVTGGDPKTSEGATYIKICDKLGRCVYATSGRHIDYNHDDGWEIDIGPNSFGQLNGFERTTEIGEGDTWYWSLAEEPAEEKKLRDLFFSTTPPAGPGERGGGGWRLLPEGRYGFNIPSY